MNWIALPYPPTLNNLFINLPSKPGRKGGRALSPEYKAWRQHAALVAGRVDKVDGPYALYLQAGRPDQRARDLDNLIKPVSDLLCAIGAITDDCHAQRINIEWLAGIVGIRALVVPTTAVGIAAVLDSPISQRGEGE